MKFLHIVPMDMIEEISSKGKMGLIIRIDMESLLFILCVGFRCKSVPFEILFYFLHTFLQGRLIINQFGVKGAQDWAILSKINFFILIKF